MKIKMATAVITSALLTQSALADEPIKLGFIATFSGPSATVGQDINDGFRLGLEAGDNKLGGRSVIVVQADDQGKPDIGRQQAQKMIEGDKVPLIVGVQFSNVMLALAKPVLDSGTFILSLNAGPSQYAGKQCNPHYFVASFQNDTAPEAMGIYMQKQGLDNIFLIASNYPGGKDMLAGFKRTFKGKIAGELYTSLSQLDYAAEIAQIRAAKPAAVFFFFPGGLAINFVKQYDQAGLKKNIPLFAPSFALDQTVLPGMGEAAVGAYAATYWPEDFSKNAASTTFREKFEQAYKRIPSPAAAQAYDGALMLNAALSTIDGKIEDKAAFQKALETVKFDSVRGNFSFNANHYPIQDFYLSQIVKDSKGRILQSDRGLIAESHPDSYVSQCKMTAVP